MKQTHLNFLIDLVAFAGFVFLSTTGVLLRYILPPGSGHATTIWGLDRHEWGGVHFWISLVFFSILSLHLVLHWRWIINVVRGRPRGASGLRAGLGLVGVIAVVALALSPVLAPVERGVKNDATKSLSAHPFEAVDIRGSMTLAEVEKATGVPVAYILDALELPAATPPDSKLGPLKREYGFEISQVREIVKHYPDQ